MDPQALGCFWMQTLGFWGPRKTGRPPGLKMSWWTIDLGFLIANTVIDGKEGDKGESTLSLNVCFLFSWHNAIYTLKWIKTLPWGTPGFPRIGVRAWFEKFCASWAPECSENRWAGHCAGLGQDVGGFLNKRHLRMRTVKLRSLFNWPMACLIGGFFLIIWCQVFLSVLWCPAWLTKGN